MEVQQMSAWLGTAALAGARTQPLHSRGDLSVTNCDDWLDTFVQSGRPSTAAVGAPESQVNAQAWDTFITISVTYVSPVLRNLQSRMLSTPRTIAPAVGAEIANFATRRVLDAGRRADSPASFDRRRRYAKLAALLDEWSAEPGDYDERASTFLEAQLRPG